MLIMLKDLIDARVGGVDVDIRYSGDRWAVGKAVDADATGIAVVDQNGVRFLPWASIEAVSVSLNDLRDRGMVPKGA